MEASLKESLSLCNVWRRHLYEAGRHLSLKIMNHMISKVYFFRVGKILYSVASFTTQ